MTAKTVNEVLQMVVDRSEAQKSLRLANMRAELIELGYSIVTTEWLNAVLKEEGGMTCLPRTRPEPRNVGSAE